jgi:hypothetical protein
MAIAVAAPSISAHAAPAAQQGPLGPKLTPAQETKANARRAKMDADLKALNASKTLTPTQKQAKFLKLKTAYESDMLDILNPEQRKKFLADKSRAMAIDAKKRATFTKLMTESQKIGKQINDSMTADQKKQLASIKAATGAQAKAIAEDKSIAPEAKKPKFDALEKDFESKVMTIMTPEQQKLFQRLLAIQSEKF